MNAQHAGVLLAAGGSLRLGRPKQLLTVAGQSLLQRNAQLLLETGAAPVIAIIGAHAACMRAELVTWPVSIIEHPGWTSGLAGSLQCAATACQHMQVSHILLLGTDQPRLTGSHLAALLRAAGPDHDVLSGYTGIAGIPAVLRRSTLGKSQQLQGNFGLGQLLRNRNDVRIVRCEALADDLDTPEDLNRARQHRWIDP